MKLDSREKCITLLGLGLELGLGSGLWFGLELRVGLGLGLNEKCMTDAGLLYEAETSPAQGVGLGLGLEVRG